MRERFPEIAITDGATPFSRVPFAYLGNTLNACKPWDEERRQKVKGKGQKEGEKRIASKVVRANPEKTELLLIWMALTATRAIPQHNFEEKLTHDVTQARMAKVLGIGRPTLTSRISNFCDPYDRAPVWERKRPRTCRGKGASVFARTRRFCQPNFYQLHLVRNRHGNGRTNFIPASLQVQMRAVIRAGDREIPNPLANAWDAACLDRKGFAGWKDIPDWVFDPALKINELTRLLLVRYIQWGLIDFGVVKHLWQWEIAEELGVTTATIRRCHAELERIGLIKVAHQTRRDDAGRWLPEGKLRIVWQPAVILSQEEALQETMRMQAIGRELQTALARAEWERAFRIHQDLLKGYVGRQHTLGQFWEQLRAICQANNIGRGMIQMCIPYSGAPPG